MSDFKRSDLVEERDAEMEAAKLDRVSTAVPGTEGGGMYPTAYNLGEEASAYSDPAAAIAEGIRRLAVVRDEMGELAEQEAGILAELDRAFEALKHGDR